MDQIPADLRLAVDAVVTAAAAARTIQADLERIGSLAKDDRSPVTVADFAVQAIVNRGLERLEKPCPIIGEEHAGVLRQDDQGVIRATVVEAVRTALAAEGTPPSEAEVLDAIDAGNHDASAATFWTLDPIDGTKGFLRGQQYSIALGLIEDGVVTAGVLCCPNLAADVESPEDGYGCDERGTVFVAVRGGGAWQFDGVDPWGSEPRPLRARGGLDETVRLVGSVEAAHSRGDDAAKVVESLGRPCSMVRIDSQCKYAVVARGDADAYLRLPTRLDYRERIWDHAAGMVLATEAGATVSDTLGAALDFTHGEKLEQNLGVVCTASALHGPIIDAIASQAAATPGG